MGACESKWDSEAVGCYCSCADELTDQPIDVVTDVVTFEQATSGSLRCLQNRCLQKHRVLTMKRSEALFLKEFAAFMRTGVKVTKNGSEKILRLTRAGFLQWENEFVLVDDIQSVDASRDTFILKTASHGDIDFAANHNVPDLSLLIADGLTMLAAQSSPRKFVDINDDDKNMRSRGYATRHINVALDNDDDDEDISALI